MSFPKGLVKMSESNGLCCGLRCTHVCSLSCGKCYTLLFYSCPREYSIAKSESITRNGFQIIFIPTLVTVTKTNEQCRIPFLIVNSIVNGTLNIPHNPLCSAKMLGCRTMHELCKYIRWEHNIRSCCNQIQEVIANNFAIQFIISCFIAIILFSLSVGAKGIELAYKSSVQISQANSMHIFSDE